MLETKKINVLGTEYTIEIKSKSEDEFLKDCDGYCDKTSKEIVVLAKPETCEIKCFEIYQKKVIRHEIIHAFLIESGLQENFKKDKWGHDETTVDWFAVQFPKLLKAFEEADAL